MWLFSISKFFVYCCHSDIKFTPKDVHIRVFCLLIYLYNQLSKTRRAPSGPALAVLLREVSSLVESRGSVTPVILKLNLSARNTGLFNLHETAKTETFKRSLQTNDDGSVVWKRNTVLYTGRTIRTRIRLKNIKHFAIHCHVEHLHFRFQVLFTT